MTGGHFASIGDADLNYGGHFASVGHGYAISLG